MKRQEIKPLKELCIRDDFMFGAVFSNPQICKEFLEKLLHVRLRKVEIIERQKTLEDSYDYHSVRLDAYVEDDAGTVYNVEMQATNRGSLPMRARRYLASIDRGMLLKGFPYNNAPPVYVIFVCDYDEVGLGYALYERETTYEGLGVAYDDKTHVCFLNSHYAHDEKHQNADADILKFLDYVRTANDSHEYESEFLQTIIREVNSVRTDEKWEVTYMTMAMKIQEERDQARAEGRAEGCLVTLIDLVKDGTLTIEKAAKKAGISTEEFKQRLDAAGEQDLR